MDLTGATSSQPPFSSAFATACGKSHEKAVDMLTYTFIITAALILQDTSLFSPSSYWSPRHRTQSPRSGHAHVFSNTNCGLNPRPVRPLERLLLSAVKFCKHLMQSDFILFIRLFSKIHQNMYWACLLKNSRQHLLVIILFNCLCAIQSSVLFLLLAGWLLSFVHIQFP